MTRKTPFVILYILLMLFSLTACTDTATNPAVAVETATASAVPTQPVFHPSRTPDVTAAAAKTPTITPTFTPVVSLLTVTATPDETLIPPCDSGYEKEGYVEYSPDGEWIAVQCGGKENRVDTYLHIVNKEKARDWKLQYLDFTDGTEGLGYPITPFYWSANGKYLYATSGTRASGCCWIGQYLLMVRLNLETGQQAVMENCLPIYTGATGEDFSISSSEHYFLLAQYRKIKILDLYTWEQRIITVKEDAFAGYTLMSKDDKKLILVLREYPKVVRGDLTYGSLLLIDLQTGEQKILFSGTEFLETPIPVRWVDENQVFLKDLWYGHPYILNIQTGALKEIDIQ